MGKAHAIRFALLVLVIAGVGLAAGDDRYFLSVLVFAGINAIAAIGLSMLMGYAGQISLGHAGFFALGGYSTALLTKVYGWPPVAALVFGLMLSGLVALGVGLPSLRLRGHYLAMATLGFGEIVYVIANAAVGLTEGPTGFSGVPWFSLLGISFRSEGAKFWLVWGLVVCALVLSQNIIHSRVGRALRAIHGDETAAAATGVNVAAYKLGIFVYSALLTSLGGSLYVHHMRFVSPSGFSLNKSILFLIMIMSGGMGSLWGAVTGAVIFTLLPEFLGVFDEYDILIYGAILMGMMMFLPTGLAGLASAIIGRVRHACTPHSGDGS